MAETSPLDSFPAWALAAIDSTGLAHCEIAPGFVLHGLKKRLRKKRTHDRRELNAKAPWASKIFMANRLPLEDTYDKMGDAERVQVADWFEKMSEADRERFKVQVMRLLLGLFKMKYAPQAHACWTRLIYELIEKTSRPEIMRDLLLNAHGYEGAKERARERTELHTITMRYLKRQRQVRLVDGYLAAQICASAATLWRMEHEELNSSNACCACLAARACVPLSTCGHTVLCRGCAAEVTDLSGTIVCPTCRARGRAVESSSAN